MSLPINGGWRRTAIAGAAGLGCLALAGIAGPAQAQINGCRYLAPDTTSCSYSYYSTSTSTAPVYDTYSYSSYTAPYAEYSYESGYPYGYTNYPYVAAYPYQYSYEYNNPYWEPDVYAAYPYAGFDEYSYLPYDYDVGFGYPAVAESYGYRHYRHRYASGRERGFVARQHFDAGFRNRFAGTRTTRSGSTTTRFGATAPAAHANIGAGGRVRVDEHHR